VTVYLSNSSSWIEKTGVCRGFEKLHDCEVKFVYFEGGVNAVSRLILEKSNPRADVIMGLSRTTFIKAMSLDLLEKYKPENAEKITGGNELSYDFYATDFDYGGLAIVYNKNKLNKTLTTFEDLTKLKRQLVFPDPRTSTLGQNFLLWTIAIYKDKWQDYWKKLKPAILTVTKGWSSAFTKLETGEADVMVSYASDKAYNIYKYKTSKFDAVVPATEDLNRLKGMPL